MIEKVTLNLEDFSDLFSNLVAKMDTQSISAEEPVGEALVWKQSGTCKSKGTPSTRREAWHLSELVCTVPPFPSANQEMYAGTSHITPGFLLSSASQANHHLQVTWGPEPSCSQVLTYLCPHHPTPVANRFLSNLLSAGSYS